MERNNYELIKRKMEGLIDYGPDIFSESLLSYLEVSLSGIVFALEAKDEYSCRHSQRVSVLCERFAAELGLSAAARRRVRITATLHDIGKIGIPDSVLLAPRRLTEEEFNVMKKHPVLGEQILEKTLEAQADFAERIGSGSAIIRIAGRRPQNNPIAHSISNQFDELLAGVRNHHERFDGKGYPDGIEGENIPFIARLIALCDSTDAMMSDRVYRKSIGSARTVEEIENNRGKMYDPELASLYIDRWDVITDGVFSGGQNMKL